MTVTFLAKVFKKSQIYHSFFYLIYRSKIYIFLRPFIKGWYYKSGMNIHVNLNINVIFFNPDCYFFAREREFLVSQFLTNLCRRFFTFCECLTIKKQRIQKTFCPILKIVSHLKNWQSFITIFLNGLNQGWKWREKMFNPIPIELFLFNIDGGGGVSPHPMSLPLELR